MSQYSSPSMDTYLGVMIKRQLEYNAISISGAAHVCEENNYWSYVYRADKYKYKAIANRRVEKPSSIDKVENVTRGLVLPWLSRR